MFWTDPLHFCPFSAFLLYRQRQDLGAEGGISWGPHGWTGDHWDLGFRIWDLGLRMVSVRGWLVLAGTKDSPSLLPAEPEGNTPQIHTNKLPCSREQNGRNFIHFSGQLKPLNEGVDSYNTNWRFFPSPVICVGLMHLFTSIILYKAANNSSACSQLSTVMGVDSVLLGWQ